MPSISFIYHVFNCSTKMAAVEILLILFDCGAFLIADMIEAPEQTLDDSVSLS